MMKHDHLDIIEMEPTLMSHKKWFICLALPEGDSITIEVSEENARRLRVRS